MLNQKDKSMILGFTAVVILIILFPEGGITRWVSSHLMTLLGLK